MSSEDSSAGLKIGRTLELARKERGLSLKQVEQATKIRARYLEELERENFGVLPAVYVQGSLKTYANFLHLDGEALVRELRRQQASQNEQQDPAPVEPPRGDYFDRSLIFLGGAAGAESQERAEDEEGAGTSPSSGGNLLYLASAAILVLILVVVALALTLPRESQPELSQIREPLVSDAPSQVSRVEGEENAPARPQQEDGEQQRTDDEKDNRQPEKRDGAQDDGEPAQTGQDEAQLAQGSAAATATPSASPTPQMEPPPAQPGAASTPPRAPNGGNVTGAPVRGAAPQPAARGTGAPAANAPPGPRGGGGFNVQVVPGSEDLVRITGSPLDD